MKREHRDFVCIARIRSGPCQNEDHRIRKIALRSRPRHIGKNQIEIQTDGCTPLERIQSDRKKSETEGYRKSRDTLSFLPYKMTTARIRPRWCSS